jgi:hypothetical protein
MPIIAASNVARLQKQRLAAFQLRLELVEGHYFISTSSIATLPPSFVR